MWAECGALLPPHSRAPLHSAPVPLRLDVPQGMGEQRDLPEGWSLDMPISGTKVDGVVVPLGAQFSSLCQETALYRNFILKKGVVAPKAQF